MRHSDLDNLVGARGEQGSRRGLVVHVNNAVLAVVEGCRRSSTATDKQNGGCFLTRAADKAESATIWCTAESRRVSVTHSSSVMDSWQLSHTRTSNSKPIRGMVERLDEHLPHTACPHFLQWCWGTQLHIHNHKDVPLLLTRSYLVPHSFWVFGFFFCRKLRSTCLKPIFLLSHICLKFQKKGCSHFWQESLSSHSGVWKRHF